MFRASHGWLKNFKAKHGIHELEIRGEKLSANSESPKEFIQIFNIKIKEGIMIHIFFNADETDLLESPSTKNESSTPN